MSINTTYDITVRQLGTTTDSAAAMLDPETESRLYHLYRQFFRDSETERNWNLWNDIPWDAISGKPSEALGAAVFTLFQKTLFMPDYAAKSLHRLRASRGRAWFWTSWSYDEGKHLLTYTEWLTRSGAYTDDYLHQYANKQLAAYRWEPPVTDAPGIFWDTLIWEVRSIQQIQEVKALAVAAEDTVLFDVLTKIEKDETAHLGFLRQSLSLIQENHADLIRDAAERVAQVNEYPGGVEALFHLLNAE